MNKKLKKSLIITVAAMFAFVLIIQYIISFNINKQPPSQKWGKGKKIATAKVNCKPKLLKYNNGYLVVFNDKDKINMLSIDKMGNVLNKKVIKINQNIIDDLSFFKQNNNEYYMSWDYKTANQNKQEFLILNKDLNKVKSGTLNDVNESFQYKDKLFFREYENKIQILDCKKNIQKDVNVKNAFGLRSVELKNGGYLIVFITKEGYLNSFVYKDGNVSKIQQICALNLATNQIVMDTCLGADNDKAYFFVYKRSKDGYENVKYSFKLNNVKNYAQCKFSLPDVDSTGEISFISNVDNRAEFVATVSRYFGIKKQYNDEVEFYLKDDDLRIGSFISKSQETSSFAVINDDKASVYCDYIPNNKNYDIYFTSTSKDFKNKNNVVTLYEKKTSIQDTLQGFMYALVYVIVLGLKWMLPVLIILGVFSFIEYALKSKFKKGLFISMSILTFILKFQTIYDRSYHKFAFYLPKQLASVKVGFAICLIISLISYVYGYLDYRKDLDCMPVIKFIPYLLIDTVLTLMVFAPYML